MKNMLKTKAIQSTAGIIALIALIITSMAGCPEPDPIILTGITLNTEAVKKAYVQNETLTLAGLVVTANYSDSTSAAVTGYTASPIHGAVLTDVETKTVTISYTEGDVTKTANFDVTVTTATKTLIGITLNTAAVKKAYVQNETLDLTSLVVTASYSNSTSAAVTGYTASPEHGAALAAIETKTVTISYTEDDVTKTANFNVTVTDVPITTFTVTFNADNGTANTTQTVAEGGTATKPATDPVKDGYTFVHWFNTADNAEWDFDTVVTAHISLKAKWNAAPGAGMDSAIPLTENQWEDGNLPTASVEQWFSFTATASTHYIHAAFGTINSGTFGGIYVQLFDSAGATSGSQTQLYNTTRQTSRTLTSGETYYIRVKSYSSSYTGTYRIGFNTSSTISPPNAVQLPSNATSLTAGQWEDGDITTADGEQWFSFTATASTQYIHADFSTLNDLYVQVYTNDGATSGVETNLHTTSRYTSRTLTSGDAYYIRVRPYSSNSGAYSIAFNTSTTAPSLQMPSNATSLTADTWADGNIPTSGGQEWFSFTATASTQYIHVSFGTLTSLYIQVYTSAGAASGSETSLNSSSTPISRTLTSGQTYYIRVRQYSSYSGDYRIAFNTSNTSPANAVQLPSTATSLTADTWANGDITTADGQQWFSFTATASTHNIHADFGTINSTYGIYVQVYASDGAAVGSETRLYSSTKYISRPSLTSGQTYHIRVRLYSSSYSGTYQIGFNTAPYPPETTFITLTADTWANGSITAGGQEWFTFTATANTQYIHVLLGTLTDLYVQVYTSAGATSGTESNIWSYTTNKYISRTLTSGQTYHIRVRPSTGSGTYRIAFNTSTTAPTTP